MTRLDTAKQRDIRAVAAAIGMTLTKDGKWAYCTHSRGPGRGTPSLRFLKRKRGDAGFACYSCGAHGDVVDLVEFWLGCNTDSALTHLVGELPKVEQEWTPLDAEVEVPYSERVKACEAFLRAAADLDHVTANWLAGRGIEPYDAAERFGLRVVAKDGRTSGQSGERAMTAALKATSADVVVALGLASVNEGKGTLYPSLFGQWLVIPYIDGDGRCGHLQFRRIHRGEAKKGPKYRHIKGGVPYPWGIPLLSEDVPSIGIVEGALDAMANTLRGFPSVGVPGVNGLSKDHAARLVRRARGKDLWVGFDADAENKDGKRPGQDSQLKALRLLHDAGADRLQATTWPDDFADDPERKDWCDWWQIHDQHPGAEEWAPPADVPADLCDVGAERRLVASALAGFVDMDDAGIEPAAFSEEALGRCWREMRRLWTHEGHMDPTILRGSVGDVLDALPEGSRLGPRYLARVRELHDARQFVERAERAIRAVKAGRSAAEQRTMLAADAPPVDGRDRKDSASALAAWREERYSAGRKVISTGIRELDNFIGGGFIKGVPNGVLAEPSVGKTTFLLTNVALRAARAGVRTLRVSMELPAAQLVAKDISHLAQIPYGMCKPTASGEFREEFVPHLDRWERELEALPLWNVFDPMTVEDVEEEIARHVRQYGVEFVVIDQYHALEWSSGKRNAIDAYHHAGRRALAIGKRFPEVTIVWLGQTPTGLTKRTDKRPTLGDWWYGGPFAHNLRVLVGIFDPARYDADSKMKNMRQFAPLKASYGNSSPSDFCWVPFDGDYQTFRTWEDPEFA